MKPSLRDRFIREFTASEKRFFLRQARDALYMRGYQAGEDLFFYCYFLTLSERLRSLRGGSSEGYARFLLVEGTRDLDEAKRTYEERLEKGKLTSPDTRGGTFIDYLCEEQSARSL